MTETQVLDIAKIRKEFPILQQEVHGKNLVYFDNAATNQKPLSVINALNEYYTSTNANIHRGIHYLAEKATSEYEGTRKAVRDFLNAKEEAEIIFTRGTTEGINLVASSYGRMVLEPGDEVIISALEHHSNIVPWQLVCKEKGAILKVIPINDAGEILFEEYTKLLNAKTKIVSVVYASNALGSINPVQEIIKEAHNVGAKVLIDGAQSTSHIAVDVQALDVDFYAFSGHKIYGPTGIGALYGKRELLDAMPPYQGGGEMIKDVSFEETTFNELPYKFEAGTPNIADTIALKKALEFITDLGIENIAEYEHQLLVYANDKLKEVPGLKLIGTAVDKVGVVSFVIENVHNYDIGMMLDAKGIAIRTGHHCTQPLMQRLCLEGTSRASFAVYNTTEEIDALVEGLKSIQRMFG